MGGINGRYNYSHNSACGMPHLQTCLRKKRTQCPYKPGSVPCGFYSTRCLPFIYAVNHFTAQAFHPPSLQESDGQPSDDGLHELAASRRHGPAITRRPVVSYTTFSPLPVQCTGGCFLLPSPAVTDSFYFQKWSVLRCPDFPPAHLTVPAADRDTAFVWQN